MHFQYIFICISVCTYFACSVSLGTASIWEIFLLEEISPFKNFKPEVFIYILYCMYVFAGVQSDSKVGTVIQKIFWEKKMLSFSETYRNYCGTNLCLFDFYQHCMYVWS